MNTKQNCTNCSHNKVCRLKGKYEGYSTFISSHLDQVESDENFDFELHIKCNEFVEIPKIPDFDSLFKNLKRDQIFIHRDPSIKSCEECEFYSRLLKTGPYVGDCPCNWCPLGLGTAQVQVFDSTSTSSIEK